MQGYPYDLRLRLSDEVPSDGQFKVMKRIPVYDGAEICNIAPAPAAKNNIRCAVFNMEHGYRNREIIPFLQTCAELKDADILFANELDDGTFRSGNIDTAKEIASALGYNYAYGLEFIELVDSRDEKGYEGNAVFSRYPIVRADVLYMPEEYNWYYDVQKRIGARVAVFAEIDMGGRHFGAVSIHLENRTDPAGRANQINAILRKAEAWFGEDVPVVMGGDYNFSTLKKADTKKREQYLKDLRAGILRDTPQYEPSFALYEQAGYDYKSFNDQYLNTCRDCIGDELMYLHIDWIFAKGMTCLGHGMVSTATEDCKKWAPADSPIQTYEGAELSDHNAVWAECKLN